MQSPKLNLRPTSILLDKNIMIFLINAIRRMIDGLSLPSWHSASFDLFLLCRSGACDGLITLETFNIIAHDRNVALANFILPTFDVLQPGKYLKRWTRRLRSFTFTQEDARMLAYATFGVNPARRLLGADTLATLDQHLINNWERHSSAIASRLRSMTAQLRNPYRDATIPWVVTPNEILSSFLE